MKSKVKTKFCFFMVLGILPFLPAAAADLQERRGVREVVLSETPIALRLPINREVIIRFPQAVIQTELLNASGADAFSTLLTPDGVLYLTALKAVEKSRMIAEMVDGKLVIMDLSGVEMGPFDGDLRIVYGREKHAPLPAAALADGSNAEVDADNNPYKPDFLKDGAAKTRNMAEGDLGGSSNAATAGGFHHMVRFGFRHYVGPARLIGDDLGKAVAVKRRDVSSMLRMNDGKLTLKPLKQWEIDGYYLTVLLVNNRSLQTVAFDPRAIRGRWVFAAALHPQIEPRGSRLDQTLWALISRLPFDEARR